MTRIHGKGPRPPAIPSQIVGVSPDGQFVLTPNPAWKGKAKGKRSGIVCHDRTPYMTIVCACGYAMHLHESQIAGIPDETELGSVCHSCGELLTMNIGWIRAALAEMWE